MSYNKSNSNKSSNGKFATAVDKSTTALGKKPFCKVCQDAGKPESEYTSHFVRTLPDINGKSIVTCPVLNSTECRYCCQLGHTTKFCPVIEKNEKKNKKDNYAAVQYQKSEQRISAISGPAVENKYRGAFAALDCEQDEAPVKKDMPIIKNNDYFPALVTKQTVAPSACVWATIAAKPAPPPPQVKQEVKPAGKPELKPYVKPELKPYLKQEVKQEVSDFLKQQVKKTSAKCWADESDSDDEDDYDIVEAPPPSLVSTADENDEWDW
jgi:hypothetical protein